jgi:hypothetical protein
MPNLVAGRLERERKTIDSMIAIYCRDRHGAASVPCRECTALAEYAHDRLERCPFGHDKPTCLNCKVHCYRSGMQDRVRTVMRHAGPRMLLRHPVLTLLHLYWDSRREAPQKAVRGRAGTGA